MSRSPTETALLHAYRAGQLPYVHTAGPLVVLVLTGEYNPLTGQHRGQCLTWMCASAGLARAVAARCLQDLVTFAGHPSPLAVSAMYAEAALRHALRRRRAA